MKCIWWAAVPLLLAGAARADTPAASAPSASSEAVPLNAISVEIPALLSAGVELDGERYFANHRFSLTVALGGQWAGGGDYSSQTYSTGLEARVWLNRLRLWFMPKLGGPYAGARVDLAVNRLLDRENGAALTSYAAVGSATIGYRLVFFNRVEATSSAGVSLTTNVDTVPSFVVGVPLFAWHFTGTLGYLF